MEILVEQSKKFWLGSLTDSSLQRPCDADHEASQTLKIPTLKAVLKESGKLENLATEWSHITRVPLLDLVYVIIRYGQVVTDLVISAIFR